ncbi:MAG: hypothetical protein EPO02_08425, partial [Nitrospirae bacterium]
MLPRRTADVLLLLLCGLPVGLAWAQPGPAPSPAADTKGPRYAHPHWGVSFAVPEAWLVTDRQAVLVVTSKADAARDGLIIVRFVRKTSTDKLRQGYAEGLEEDGLRLMPAAQLQNFPAGGQ